MGYELQKLMNMYGVSTPTMAPAPQMPGAAPTAVAELVKPELRAQPAEPVKPTKPGNNAPAAEKEAYQAALTAYNAQKNAYDTDIKAWKEEKKAYDTALKDYNTALPKYQEDLAKYEKDKAAFDETMRKYGLDKAQYDQYAQEYQNRLANTNLYNQAQFSTTGANVPPITTFSDAQKAAVGMMPATGQVGGPQSFSGIGQGGLNQTIQNYMNTNPSAANMNAVMTRYGLTDYDMRNALGTGTTYGAPQWTNVLKPPVFASAMPTTPVNPGGTTAPGTVNTGTTGMTGTTATVYDPDKPYFNDPNWHGSSAWRQWIQSQDKARGGYIQNYAEGGTVRGYAPGGIISVGAGDDVLMGRPAGDMLTPAPVPVVEDPQDAMMAMLARYATPVDRSAEIAAANERVAAERKAFEEMLLGQLDAQDNAPQSKAEMYFRLAAAFGAPTKTGHFSENLALVGQTMADELAAKAKREREAREKKLGVRTELQKMRMEAAGEELGTLRGLQEDETKYGRELARDLIKDYIASGKPQSEAGKIATDMGLKPGTPEYNEKVAEITELKIQREMAAINATLASTAAQQTQANQMNATELKLRAETEDILAGVGQSLADLKEAFRLNPNTFAGGLYDQAALKAGELVGSDDPRVVNTRLLLNLLESQALEKLKATFGGSGITNAEREALSALQGAGAKSTKEREQIIMRAYEVLQDIQARQTKKLDDILSGAYRQYKPIDGGE